MGYELFYIIGAMVLLAALGYGLLRNIGRNRRKDAIRDAATREQYDHPRRYRRTQKQFEKAAERVGDDKG
jgi:hypothetical protein